MTLQISISKIFEYFFPLSTPCICMHCGGEAAGETIMKFHHICTQKGIRILIWMKKIKNIDINLMIIYLIFYQNCNFLATHVDARSWNCDFLLYRFSQLGQKKMLYWCNPTDPKIRPDPTFFLNQKKSYFGSKNVNFGVWDLVGSLKCVFLYVFHIPAEISIHSCQKCHDTLALSRRYEMFNRLGQK